MKIEHIAIWVNDLNKMKEFYVKYFSASFGKKYSNPTKKFSSYFLSFNSSCRIELMHNDQIKNKDVSSSRQDHGLAHFAISVGSKQKVNELTEVIRKDGFEIISEPRTTGDGYYENVISDPEMNRIEITI